MSKSLRFSPYVCPECQSLVMNFETVDGVDICGLCETPLIEYKAIPAAELAALTQRAEKAEEKLHQQTHETVGAEMSRDAWKEFALHQTTCAECADSVMDCEIGVNLWKETGEFEE